MAGLIPDERLSRSARRTLSSLSAKIQALQDAQESAGAEGASACLATWRRGTRERPEELRLILGRYQGEPLLSLRIWRRVEPLKWVPTPRGVSLRLGELPELLRVLEQLQRRQDYKQPKNETQGE